MNHYALCRQCRERVTEDELCDGCGLCDVCCNCTVGRDLYDADELGLDPEDDDERAVRRSRIQDAQAFFDAVLRYQLEHPTYPGEIIEG